MHAEIESGKYVIAVSGGVDSVVLLDILSKQKGLTLVVAHFDHGMREESAADRLFVQQLSRQYQIPFVYEMGELGSGASEAVARKARYEFLRKIQAEHGARAVATAHHQDDLIETAIINLARGTGRRGLTSLGSNGELVRPLLSFTKKELVEYAHQNNLTWREDKTNNDPQYLRNHIRHTVMPKFGEGDRKKFLSHLNDMKSTNQSLERLLPEILGAIQDDGKLDRKTVAGMPETIIKELLMFWWRENGLYNYESKTLARATENILHGKTGAIVPLKGDYSMKIERTKLALNKHER